MVTHNPCLDRRVQCSVLLSIPILKPLKTSSGQILARALKQVAGMATTDRWLGGVAAAADTTSVGGRRQR